MCAVWADQWKNANGCDHRCIVVFVKQWHVSHLAASARLGAFCSDGSVTTLHLTNVGPVPQASRSSWRNSARRPGGATSSLLPPTTCLTRPPARADPSEATCSGFWPAATPFLTTTRTPSTRTTPPRARWWRARPLACGCLTPPGLRRLRRLRRLLRRLLRLLRLRRRARHPTCPPHRRRRLPFSRWRCRFLLACLRRVSRLSLRHGSR